MCQVNFYRGAGKIAEEVSSFEIDTERRVLILYSVFGEKKEFSFAPGARFKWSETDHSLVLEERGA